MTLQQLKYIVTIAEHLNFTQAALSENVAQPSMSVLVKKFEDELGVMIFDRSQRGGIRITEVGELVIEQARLILRESERLQDVASSFKKKTSGVFKLGIIPTICPYLIPHFMRNFAQKNPDVNLHTVEESTKNLIHRLAVGTLDAAILSTPEEAPLELMEKVLYYEPFVFFGHRKHELLNLEKLKSETLKPMAPLLLDETHCLRDQILDLCQSSRKRNLPVSLDAGSLNSLMAIVDVQNSFTLLPILALSGLSREKIQKQVRIIVDPIPLRKVSLVFNKTLVKRTLLEALESSILDSLPEDVHRRVSGKYSVLEPKISHFYDT